MDPFQAELIFLDAPSADGMVRRLESCGRGGGKELTRCFPGTLCRGIRALQYRKLDALVRGRLAFVLGQGSHQLRQACVVSSFPRPPLKLTPSS